MTRQGIILGAGIIGSAIAYELSRRGVTSLRVLDADLEGSLSSTERNAGGVRHLWNQPINRELSKVSIDFFSKHSANIGFQPKGYLWLFSHEKAQAGKDVFAATQEHGLSYELLAPSEIKKRYPFLDKLNDVSFGLFGQKDGILNSNALKQFYQSEAKKKGVEFVDGVWIEKIEKGQKPKVFFRKLNKENALCSLEAPEHSFANSALEIEETDFIVLALGAWTKPFSQVNEIPILSKPVRRQICFFSSEQFDMSPYGMIVDTSGVYFHPEGGRIIGGIVLKDEPEGFRFSMDPDFFESHIWPALYERSSFMERLKSHNGWGGLYSYTKDTTGILGALPNFPGVFEAHSFTGHGVMQSYGVAVAISDLILKGKFDTIDASGLNRNRFTTGALLTEALHI